jgi:adenylate cyclase
MGQWHYSLVTDKLPATMQIVNRIYALAEKQKEPALFIGAYRALACTSYFLGDFENTRQNALRSLQMWRSGAAQSHVEEVDPPAVACLCDQALSEWHLGAIVSCEASIAQAIAVARQLNDMHGLAQAFLFAGWIAYFERNPAEVERLAAEVVELATRHNFAFWLTPAAILSGWARSASGQIDEGITRIENGIRDYRAMGSTLGQPFNLALKAEALHLANRTSEALEAIREAEALAERSEERWWSAELNRLRGVFLTAVSANETQVEASFCEAIRIAKEQKSVSLEKRAEGTYAEYRRQKASALGQRGFRLPLC